MKVKKDISFNIVKGTLPKEKKVHYEWEKTQKQGLEPWHFSTISLILDVLILIIYLFVDQWVTFQIPLGYVALLLSVISIIMSYLLLKIKQWSISIVRYTRLINSAAISITVVMVLLTMLLSS